MSGGDASAADARTATGPFQVPRGLLGRVAGWTMAHANRSQQRELLEFIAPPPQARAIEVGYGPGELVRLLAAAVPAGFVAGVDVSEVMYRRATRVNRRAIEDGRVDLRVTDAASLPFPDMSFDVAVTVNSLLLWPDPEAGTEELRRVLRPDGTAYVAWHAPRTPRRLQRRLSLSPTRMLTLRAVLRDAFPIVNRRDLRYSTVYVCRLQT